MMERNSKLDGENGGMMWESDLGLCNGFWVKAVYSQHYSYADVGTPASEFYSNCISRPKQSLLKYLTNKIGSI